MHCLTSDSAYRISVTITPASEGTTYPVTRTNLIRLIRLAIRNAPSPEPVSSVWTSGLARCPQLVVGITHRTLGTKRVLADRPLAHFQSAL